MTNRLINLTAFTLLAILWLCFGAALLFNAQLLQTAWMAFRGWPLVGQVLITLLTLPVVVGLWVWQTPWPVWLRLMLVIGLAWVTLYTFFPKEASGQPETSSAKA
jgi:hypothetical protein